MGFEFKHSYQQELPGTFLEHLPDQAPNPSLFALNAPYARALGLDLAALEREGAAWFSGASLPPGAAPVALAYAGHQFGGFSPSLGDGRAHLLGEFTGADGRLWDLQLKGSGRTPFSRGADGKAALGPMLREFLISEAMAALGVPTTRALAVTLTGETILRDRGPEPGAVLARVAASHLRVGTFQFFAARRETEKLRAIADYAIQRHYPQLVDVDQKYLAFFDAVAARQAGLIAAWMGLGFIHGVMNTDNMAISGETIDYGPCAFMEAYAPGTVFSSIDRQGRYAWANQPLILTWNLARLAETLLPLIDADEEKAVALLNERLEGIAGLYRVEWLKVMRRKLALPDGAESDEAEGDEAAGDEALIEDFLTALAGSDWTLGFRRLADWLEGREGAFSGLFADFSAMQAWLPRWTERLGDSAAQQAAAARLRAANPAVIPRNHQVEAALKAATEGDREPFRQLLAAIREPFSENEAYALPAPAAFGRYVTFCGT